MKYDYVILRFVLPDLLNNDLDAMVEQYGIDGWDLVSVNNFTSDGKITFLYHFKRPYIQENTTPRKAVMNSGD